MDKRKPAKIVDISAQVTLEELRELDEASEDETLGDTKKPKTLKLSQIEVADKVFQWRVPGTDLQADEEHTRGLIRHLEDTKDPLDPILVVNIKGRYFVVDGHHRLQAYHSVKWSKPIPVECFGGNLGAARLEALGRNSKNKLPLTDESKQEAAWKLVKEGKLSKKQINEWTKVSTSTIANMRKKLKALPNEFLDLSWREVLKGNFKSEGFDREEWRSKAVIKLTEQLMKTMKPGFTEKPDILCEALEAISPALPRAMVSYWLEVAKEAVAELDELEADSDL